MGVPSVATLLRLELSEGEAMAKPVDHQHPEGEPKAGSGPSAPGEWPQVDEIPE